MTTLNGQSENILNNNIAALRELFPEVCCEGKIDFDKLKQVLGEYTDDSAERYNFTWNGKGQALRLSQTPSMGTLRPCKEESKNWDDTQNLYIEGDNLEVLKLLQKSYHGKIKMIYIDPPYNTGSDFVYPDDFSDSLENYKEITGQVDAEGRKVSTNSEANGRYHTDWLNMMYPRLRLARNLLTDDGVIFISIDDNEQGNLKKVCDEIFGETNFITSFIWAAGRKNDSKFASISHEYMLCYVKSLENLKANGVVWLEKKQGLDDIYTEFESLKSKYGSDYSKIQNDLRGWFKSLPDNHPAKNHSHYSCVDEKGIYFAADISWPGGGGPKYEVLHPITKKPVKIPNRGWVYPTPERMQEIIDSGKVHFGQDETSVPCIKSYLTEKEYAAPYSVFYKDGRASTKRLRGLMEADVFQNPKDEEVVQSLIEFTLTKDSIVLDFFSGSATTAHAVFLQNAKDEGNRRFILVQLPEATDEKDNAYKAGYKNICEIGKERIRRAGEKIKAEVEEQNAQLKIGEEPKKAPDIGFKDFKLDTSNLKKWQPDYDEFEQSLWDSVGNYVDGRSELDVVYEIMLKMGLDLTWPLETHTYGGKNVYTI
ncbi:MAG: site-specific DNA-methyltransferase, partial [Oscillibacter sp.]|nr:site-specific DNA-methyltransferase [Oscillibacter sp.]